MSKDFFIGVGLTALLAIGVIFYLLRQHKAETDGLNSLIEADKGQIAYHQNRARESIAQSVQARVSLQEYKDAHATEVAAILKQFDIRQGQLTSFLKASFQAQDKGVSVVHDAVTIHPTAKDSLASKVLEPSAPFFVINDKFLNLSGQIKQGDFFQEVEWEYTYTDTISFLGHVKRKNLFAKQTYWVDGLIKNPKAKITSMRDIQITQFKDKRFSVGPGILLDPFSMRLVVGIGVQYSIFKF